VGDSFKKAAKVSLSIASRVSGGSEGSWGLRVKALAYKVLCLTVAVGFAPASQLTHTSSYVPPALAAATARPASSLGGALNPMSEETAFFYNVAISGHPEAFVDDYARAFDESYAAPSMNDEFERARYRAAIRAKLMGEVGKIDFSERFTFVCPVVLGEYSFTERAFPLEMDRDTDGFASFSHDAGTLVFGVNPFIAGKPVNVSEIRWSLPMTEGQGSTFVKSRTGRSVMMKVTYAVTRKKTVIGGRSYLAPYIEGVEIYSDDGLTQKLGDLDVANGNQERASL
jgi:hypothetical protein